MKKITDTQIAAVFQSYPKPVREKLLALRQLIFDTAATIEGVGELQETLKWGQPSYLTIKPKSGTTIRIDQVRSTSDQYALYVHCQTTLIDTFKEMFPDELTYEGNRSIVFNIKDNIPTNLVRHFISLALTYHARKTR